MCWSFVYFETGKKKCEGCTVIDRFGTREEAEAFREEYFDRKKEQFGDDWDEIVFWDGYRAFDIIPSKEEW